MPFLEKNRMGLLPGILQGMNLENWLRMSTIKLGDSGLATARLDSLILLEDVTQKDRSWLLAHTEERLEAILTKAAIKKLDEQIEQRSAHLPLAYIRHSAPFYKRDFYVDRSVLTPRPESESMIELLKSFVKQSRNADTTSLRIADIGSGSGALGITASLEIPNTDVHFYDIDPMALSISKRNADHFHIQGEYYEQDLRRSAPLHYDVLLCNLPYVPDNYAVNTAASHEPKHALFGGADGLDLYRALFERVVSTNQDALPAIITESLSFQHEGLQNIAFTNGYEIVSSDGLGQLFVSAKSLVQHQE